jgi:thioester reductase-like protein
MAAKVLGAWHVHALTQHLELDQFVLVSSIAGTLGSAGQAGYAAANTFLDALAARRKSHGLPCSSLAFGPMQFGLAGALDARQRARLTRQGLVQLSAKEVRLLFQRCLARPEAELIAAVIDLRKLGEEYGAAVPPVWQAVLRKTLASKTAQGKNFLRDLAQLSDETRAGRMMDIVREQVARTLSISSADAVSLDVPLKNLGLDSLTALELNNALARETGLKVPATLIFEQPTVRIIAEHLGAQAGGAPQTKTSNHVEHEAQFRADAVLDPLIRRTSPAAAALRPESVLLTGATGFLGAHLLADLLRSTRAQISCHVRAADVTSGTARVIENLCQYGLWRDEYTSRLAILPGDLRQPRLGLDAATWERLAETLDAIYNNGALLGFVADYRDMKASHVDPTNEMLRLAASGRVKAVHHVSSTVVFDSRDYRQRTITESTEPLESREIYVGYSQCKWVSETLVRAAAARGIPVTIYRPDFIAGSARDGGFNTADFLARLFKSIIELGIMPGDLDLELYFSPVDYVSGCIAFLSPQPASQGRTFHLQNPRAIHLEALGNILRSLGYEVRAVPYHDWLARLETWSDGPLAPLLPFLEQRWGREQLTYMELMQRQHRPRLTCDQTLQALATSGIDCPAVDDQLIARYLRYFAVTGFIASPPFDAEGFAIKRRAL